MIPAMIFDDILHITNVGTFQEKAGHKLATSVVIKKHLTGGRQVFLYHEHEEFSGRLSLDNTAY